MKNGHGDWDDPKVTSLASARKAAEQRKRSDRWARLNLKERLVGLVLIALAVGMLIYWARKLAGSFSFAP
jgi:hypothetical protein